MLIHCNPCNHMHQVILWVSHSLFGFFFLFSSINQRFGNNEQIFLESCCFNSVSVACLNIVTAN